MSVGVAKFWLGVGVGGLLCACHPKTHEVGSAESPASPPSVTNAAPEASASRPPPPVGKILEESSSGQVLTVLEGQVVRFETVGGARDVELRFLGFPPGSDVSLAISFASGRGWSSRCDVVLFATGSGSEAVDAEGEGWRQLAVVDRASSGASLRIDASMGRADFDLLSAAPRAGLQICGDRGFFTDEQRDKIADFVEATVAAAGPSVTSAKTVQDGAIGIAACDEYLTKYRRCVEENAPAELRGAMRAALRTTEDAWHQAIKKGAETRGLEKACLAALNAGKQTTAAWHCEF